MKETLRRMRKNWEFKRVYRKGRKIPGFYSSIYFYKNGSDVNRFGFSISKKVGNSVCRHRIRRLYFESLRRMQSNLRKGYDLVVVARKPASGMDYMVCRKEMENLVKRARLWIYEGK